MIKKISFQFFVCMICIAGIMAQPVIKNQFDIGGTGHDETHCILQTKDGGVVLGGRSTSNKSGQKTQNVRGAEDYWIIKMDKHGKIEWDKTIGGFIGDFLETMIETNDGGIAMVGASYSIISIEKNEDSRGFADAWVVKLDRKGNIQWDKTIGGSNEDAHFTIKQAGDGGYVLAGFSTSDISGEKTENGRGDADYWLIKLDKMGNKIWDKTIGGNSYDICTSFIFTSDGGMAVCGFSGSDASGEKSENSHGGPDIWVVKLNKSGKIEWDKTIGGSDVDLANSIVQTDDGSYLIGASSNSNISGDKTEDCRGVLDWWLVKLDKNGNKILDKTIGGNSDDNDFESPLIKTADKGYLLGGKSLSDISGEKSEASRGGFDYWVIKVDKNLNIQWDKTIGGSGHDYVLGIGSIIEESKAGIYLVGGTSESPVSGDKTLPGLAAVNAGDYWLVELDGNSISKTPQAPTNKNANVLKHAIVPEAFSAYLVPIKNILYIRAKGKTSITITDRNGKQVLAQTIDNSGAINVASLPGGIYDLQNNITSKPQQILITK